MSRQPTHNIDSGPGSKNSGQRARSQTTRSEAFPEEPQAAQHVPVLSRVPRTERMLNLIAFLLRSLEPVSAEEILMKVHGYDDGADAEARMRRFERDKKLLRDLGVPIQFVQRDDLAIGYFIARDCYDLGEVVLPEASHSLLRALAVAARQTESGQFRDDLRSALLKMGFDAGPTRGEVVIGSEPGVEGQLFDLKLNSQESAAIELLSEAVLTRSGVKFRYYTISRDVESERVVSPFGLGYAGQGWARGAWYLVGYCHTRQDIRVFRVSRIRGAVQLFEDKARVEPPASFKLSDYVARPLWEHFDLAEALRGPELKQNQEDSPELLVKLKVQQAAVTEICEQVPSARIIEELPDAVIMELPVVSRRPFLRFLMRFRRHLTVLAPDELALELKQFAASVLARYSSSGEPS